MKITPAKRIRGQLSLSGDKSISHRAAMIAALSQGASRLTNFATSADCASTLGCLEQLGIVVRRDGNTVHIDGRGLHGFQPPTLELDCGNSGSTIRMLAGILAAQRFDSILTGDQSLRSRPMKRIIGPLQEMGSRIDSDSGRPPLRVYESAGLKPISYDLPVASAQVKSCILLAGLHVEGKTTVIERSFVTRDHTERMLSFFGAAITTTNGAITVRAPAQLQARDVSIPGDLSSAAFFLGAAALLPNSSLGISGVGTNPTRTAFLDVLPKFGAQVERQNSRVESNEPRDDIFVRTRFGTPVPRALVLRSDIIPQLIDELPLLGVMGSQLTGGIEIRGASELRVKEADRIYATVTNLRAMGAEVDEFDDGFVVTGNSRLRGAVLNSFGDHRIAMAFTIAALIAEGETEISDHECVNISFPEFFQHLDSITER